MSEDKLDNNFVRMGAAAATIIAMLVWLWPSDWSDIDRASGAAFISTFGAWVYTEIVHHRQLRQHPHDIQLVRKLKGEVSDAVIRNLKDHDFGGTWQHQWFSPLWELSGRIFAVEYEFTNRRLNDSFSRFRKSLRKLDGHLAYKGGPIRGSAHLFSLVPTQEFETDQISARTFKHIDDANAYADETASNYEAFIRVARDTVPAAFSSEG